MNKIMKIEPLKHVKGMPYDPKNLITHSYDVVRSVERGLQKLEEAYRLDSEIHDRNIEAIKNNIELMEYVRAFMESIGMPKTWSEIDKKSRAQYPKRIWHDAGYLNDIKREIQITDGWDSVVNTYSSLKTKYENYMMEESSKKEKQKAAKAMERELELEKRKADMELAVLLLRYQLPIEFSWDEVLEHLCSIDPLANMAVAMILTRHDYSDGPWRVKNALGLLDSNTDMYRAISHIIENFEDGRSFRDFEYNYDYLLSVVDKTLSDDIKLVLDRVELP